MIGIIIELILSWVVLWFVVKKHLTVLGFSPLKSRLKNLAAGLLLAGICCIVYHILETAFINNTWTINKRATIQTILSGSWWTLRSVLFEELLFRGALLYLAIEKLGTHKGCILSAICFGIYHWFSYNAFGSPVQMIVIFFMTGIFGLMLGYAFAKTRSLYLPIGLHFGWNFINIVLFSGGPIGKQILVKTTQNKAEGTLSLFIFLFQVFVLPVLAALYFKFFLKGKRLPSGS